MSNVNRIETGLKPRAIAVLCALRSGPKNLAMLADAIGDHPINNTKELLAEMCRELLLGQVGNSVYYYLDHDGIGWLQNNGLDAVHEARLWVAQEAAGL